MLNIAVKAARRAGTIINRASLDLDLVKVSEKGPQDFVTEVDHAAESAIIETLRTAFPEHDILAEESGAIPGETPASASASAQSSHEYQWIIDPLDGTTNFIHGVPHYCVSIALRYRGLIVHAVVYDPNRNELFTASRGRGAFVNDRRMRVARRIKLSDALVATSLGAPARQHQALFNHIVGQSSSKLAGIRRSGSSVLDLAYVAAGRLDGYFGLGLQAWDMAASSLLISESGGLVTDFKGEQDYLETGMITAGNAKLLPQFFPMLVPFTNPSAATPSL